MIRLLIIGILTAFALAPDVAPRAQGMGTTAGYDLDQLWERAQTHFDLSGHDAVLLLEARRVTVHANGDIDTRLHRVVWVGTAVAIRSHADLRVPWNSETSTFAVSKLRTWRDGRWWPDGKDISPTAVVETLPYAVARADDYTGMRETMLLHDGVEMPCIVETVYEIDERGAGADGADGHWVFARRDPAANVEYAVTIPAGESLSFESGNGAPEPVVTSGADGTKTYSWKMEGVAALGTPLIDDPAVYKPYVYWSTWDGWAALGRKLAESFDDAAVTGEALADTLAARLEGEYSAWSKARAAAALVDETTRVVHYDPRFWMFAPRDAIRTWETAYGHGLDRAVLAAALFRRAGLDAGPVLRSIGPGGVHPEVPGLSRFGGVEVWVEGDAFRAVYDPVAGTMTGRPRPPRGRVMWKPGVEDAPPSAPDPENQAVESRFEVEVTLEPDEAGGWSGAGYLNAEGVFSPHDRMAGLGGRALAAIRQVAASIVPGAAVNGYNPVVFERGRVAVGFELTLDAPEPDPYGRTPVALGEPAGGIADHLPADVHLYNERRGSPVLLSGDMTQRVRIRLKTPGREVLHLPQQIQIANGAGEFELKVENGDKWVALEHVLTLNAGAVAASAWPELRMLLLEYRDSAGATVLLQ